MVVGVHFIPQGLSFISFAYHRQTVGKFFNHGKPQGKSPKTFSVTFIPQGDKKKFPFKVFFTGNSFP